LYVSPECFGYTLVCWGTEIIQIWPFVGQISRYVSGNIWNCFLCNLFCSLYSLSFRALFNDVLSLQRTECVCKQSTSMVFTTEVWYLEGTALFLSPHFRSCCGKLRAFYPVHAAGTFAVLACSDWVIQRTTDISLITPNDL
jgi:hypothetical protein